ncbi:MAG TPA: FAD-binding oxidoreductase [Oscillatoriaceae cyanobacterium]
MLNTLETLPVEPFALAGLTPREAVRPHDVAQAAQAIARAHAESWAVVPWGGGSHQGLGNAPSRYDLALLTSGLTRIRDHQPADLTLTVEAGATLQQVQGALAPHGQYLPLEVEDPARATIGGLLATNLAGPLRFSHGTPRDLTLWIEALRPDGTLVHGGAKVVKSVAGYDTPKLFIGSLGSVGLITAATFKVAPLPETRRMVLLGFREADHTEEVLAKLLAGGYDPSLLTLVWGATQLGDYIDTSPWILAIGADGPRATTDWQVEAFAALGREFGTMSVRTLDESETLRVRRALMANRALGEVSVKLNLAPNQLARVLGHLDRRGQFEYLRVFCEAGNGVVRIAGNVPTDWWREMAVFATEIGGTWTLERAPLELKRGVDVWGPERGDRALMRQLKAALDPTSTLNPGRFAGG